MLSWLSGTSEGWSRGRPPRKGPGRVCPADTRGWIVWVSPRCEGRSVTGTASVHSRGLESLTSTCFCRKHGWGGEEEGLAKATQSSEVGARPSPHSDSVLLVQTHTPMHQLQGLTGTAVAAGEANMPPSHPGGLTSRPLPCGPCPGPCTCWGPQGGWAPPYTWGGGGGGGG